MSATEITVFRTLDVTNTFCPVPVIQAQEAIREIPVGEVLEIVATDEGSDGDIPAWAKHNGHELIESIKDSNLFKFYIRRLK
jgi:tRNA 2-thiouridine synthesizing protein A